MKTRLPFTQKKGFSRLGVMIILMTASLAFHPIHGQSREASTTQTAQKERIIKGLISDSYGPLESANVVLKGTKIGAVTDSKGEFTFPKALKTGDILLISYLGYETEEVKIEANTSFIKTTLSEGLIEFVGALNTDKPYKSKKPKH